eukprot:10435653-Alexandrium_andersonii.AAC.1
MFSSCASLIPRRRAATFSGTPSGGGWSTHQAHRAPSRGPLGHYCEASPSTNPRGAPERAALEPKLLGPKFAREGRVRGGVREGVGARGRGCVD